MNATAHDLVDYINASPTPYHAVEETARRLRAVGYTPLDERASWSLQPGDRHYVIRHEGSIVAFEIGSGDPAQDGFRIVGAHSDSPNLRLKPSPDRVAAGTRQVVVEPYGGVLLNTWFDRDCSIAGRVTLDDNSGGVRTVLVDFKRALARVPMLAIHLYREIREEGFKPNAQQHMQPIIGLEGAPDFRSLLASQLEQQGESAAKILAFDLMLYEAVPATLSGAQEEFVHAGRLDNLGSCHVGVNALVAATQQGAAPFTRVVALWDHEECGSRSAHGAAGPLLRDVISRVTGGAEGMRRALAQSALISADMAHAVHPNYAERSDPEHLPVLGRGPVVKWNVNQAYTSDAATVAMFVSLCEQVGVVPQYFASRNDIRCGSTIGPINAALLGVRTVDVGNPMLSMHSCREMCAAADVPAMTKVLAAFFGGG